MLRHATRFLLMVAVTGLIDQNPSLRNEASPDKEPSPEGNKKKEQSSTFLLAVAVAAVPAVSLLPVGATMVPVRAILKAAGQEICTEPLAITTRVTCVVLGIIAIMYANAGLDLFVPMLLKQVRAEKEELEREVKRLQEQLNNNNK